MLKYFTVLAAGIILLFSCEKIQQQGGSDSAEDNNSEAATMLTIDNTTADNVINKLIGKYGENKRFRIERGVRQCASLWRDTDGNAEEFAGFCEKNFIADEKELDIFFDKIQTNYEIIQGYLGKMNLELNQPVQLTGYELRDIDLMFGAWNPWAHLEDDFYANKIAFAIALNFPHYSLSEKMQEAPEWSRKDWAYARAGDLFTSRVPAEAQQRLSRVMADADHYISNYNIHVGYLVDDAGNTFFPKDKKLITHWNLRDELKSQYAESDGLEKQKMIYEVMKHIINQTIPEKVIDSDEFTWNPYTNEVKENGKVVGSDPEPNTRYLQLLNNFHACREIDKYNPAMPTYIQRKFDGEMEIPVDEVEELFIRILSSPAVQEVGNLIKKRLGRDLQPFDIWYDGFKARSSISESELSAKTKAKYPNPEALKKDLPEILKKLGFVPSRADYIASKIVVDPSRGAGHASGATMKRDVSHLRTRIGEDGMDYKGYNIAVHEFGHNVEQTLSMQDVDNFFMSGVPNTAFTEAWAFIFQKRDLELLGMKETNPDKKYLDILDNFWGAYEIMGVSLVDIRVWKWLYENPDATVDELKESVIRIAKDVWNEFYAPVFGIEDQPVLAVYSHMIEIPLYLSAYPIGNLIEFQVEKWVEGKNLADEMQRILVQGRVLPQVWMQNAVGEPLSAEPIIEAASQAAQHLNK